MREKGIGDIGYCNTTCIQENCERNLRFRKPPTQFYSVSSFDENNKDISHSNCKYKFIKSENKCSKCGTVNSLDAKFCPECGKKLRK